MTPSSADTAEIPLVAPARLVVTPPPVRPPDDRPALVIVTPPAPPEAAAAESPGAVIPAPAESAGPRQRCQLVAERRHARRQQHLLALAGLAVLAGSLGATVAIVDVLH